MWSLRRRTEEHAKAEAALEDAEKNLDAIKKRGAEVSRISEALRNFRERNHLGEQLEAVIIRSRDN